MVDRSPIRLAEAENPRVSILIPSSAPEPMLLSCLDALQRHLPPAVPSEVIVVLNDATEEKISSLRSCVTGLRLVTSRINLGLPGAGNRGRAAARGDLLVLLHDDAEVESGWLEALLEVAESRPDAGAIGSLALRPDGRVQNCGNVLWRNGTSTRLWVDEQARPDRLSEGVTPVDYTGSSSLLVRAATWDAVGGLDERFYPVYFVDIDLAMSIRSIGQNVLFQPTSSVIHHQGTSTGLRFRKFLLERNRGLLCEKWREVLEREHIPQGEDLAASMHEAQALTASAAEERRAGFTGIPASAMQPADGDDFDYLAAELAVQREFAAALEERIDELEARLQSIESGKLWRLRKAVWRIFRI